MPRLSLSFLGSFEARLDDTSVTGFDSDKVRALLVFLVLEADCPHTRESLAGLLWPDFSERAAKANLRNSLSNLRHILTETLASPSFFLITPGTIQFNPSSSFWCDVAVFEQDIKIFHAYTTDAETAQTPISHLEAAIALYRGRFLEGFSLKDSSAFDDWLFLFRERLQHEALAVLYQLAEHYIQRGDFDKASHYALRQVELEPWQEEAHRQLMRLLALSGQRSAALAQFEICRRYLVKELAVEPATETIQLYEQIRDGQIGPVGEIKYRLHNLPAALSPLVGREKELAEIGRSLNDPACRLLTLVGPGGSGKTRLALEAGAKQLSNFQNGVYVVSLAPLHSVDEIIPAIAQSLNLTFQPSGEPQTQIQDYLRNKKILLLLDNFEHLLDGVNLVVELLQHAPEIKILATSRTRLKIKDEFIIPVEGLAYPELSSPEIAPSDIQDILQTPSERLFLESARRVQPGFEPNKEDLAAIIGISRLVEGMPLWILMASSWLGVLTPSEIAAEIHSHSLDFLESDWQDVPERQRSLRVVFDYSWKLLSEREKEAFAGLSVFRGGFTVPAVQKVTGISLRELMSFTDKMLVHRSSAGRFELHLLLGQYSAEKLTASPAASEIIHDRHCAYFMQATNQWALDLRGSRQQIAMQEMAADFENVQDAWAWAVGRCQEERMYQALDGLGEYYEWYGRYQAGEKAFNTAVIVLTGALPSVHADRKQVVLRTQARALAWQGSFNRILGQVEIASGLLNHGLVLLDDPAIDPCEARAERALLLHQKGQLIYAYDPEGAYRLYQQSLDIYREMGDSWKAAQIMVRLGQVDNFWGRYRNAREFIQESLMIRRSMGDWRGVADSLVELFTTAVGDGKSAEMDCIMEELVRISRQIGVRTDIANSLFLGGCNLCYQGSFAKACQRLEEAVDLYEEMGMRIQLAWTKCILGWAESNLGLYLQCNANIKDSLEIGKEVGLEHVMALNYMSLGGNEMIEENLTQARQYLEQSVSIYRQINNQSEYGVALSTLAEAERRSGEKDEAKQHLREALRIAIDSNSWETKINCVICYSLYLLDQQAYEKAVELYALVSQHPYISKSRYREDFAGKPITLAAAMLKEEVVAAAKIRAQTRDLDSTVNEIFAELST